MPLPIEDYALIGDCSRRQGQTGWNCSLQSPSTVLIGRRKEAEALLERLPASSDDLADPRERCMLGNFPRALTHLALINTARLLSIPEQQAKRASEQGERPAAAAATP